MTEFKEFQKISRLSRECVVSEKDEEHKFQQKVQ